MYAELYACMRKTFGCMDQILGCMYAERLGAKYAVVGCKVCGDVWIGGGWVQDYGAVGCMPDSR